MVTLTTRHPRRRATQLTLPPATGTIETAARPDSAATGSFMEPGRRKAMICEAAYFLSERRAFCPGRELDDWLAAESEIDRALTSGPSASDG